MAIITKLEKYTSSTKTTLNGVVDATATYEVVNNILIIRTTSHDTIHIPQDIGKALTEIINKELLS